MGTEIISDDPGQPAVDESTAQPKTKRAKRRRRLIAWGFGGLACLLVATSVTGYLMFRHLNGNIRQADIRPMLGDQPADVRPQAQNILVIGSDTRLDQGFGSTPSTSTDQSDTLMLIHVSGDRKWAEVMSIPRDSWVNIPSCEMGNGQMASPRQFKINESFAIGNLYGNHAATGAACTIKTIEQDTGIYIDHFVVVDFNGFRDMVAALGGVPECNPVPINDPQSGLNLSAGYHMLTPDQALVYVRARYGLGNGSDLERITRQQAFMSSLIGRVKGKMLDPPAIYGFLNAATRSLTIDSQLGGLTGIYSLGQSLRGISSDKIAFFTIPNVPRGDGANVLWTQPEDNAIFSSIRDDVPASPALFGGQSTGSGQSTGIGKGLAGGSMLAIDPTPAAPTPVSIPGRTASQSICVG